MTQNKKSTDNKRKNISILLKQGKEVEKTITQVKEDEKTISKSPVVEKPIEKKVKKQKSSYVCKQQLHEIDISDFENNFLNFRAYSALKPKLKFFAESLGFSLTDLVNRILIKWIEDNEEELRKIIDEHKKSLF